MTHKIVMFVGFGLILSILLCPAAYAFGSFRHGDKYLTGAYVKEVTQRGVEVAGKDEKGDIATVVVPLEEAAKMPWLKMKAGKEIASALTQPQRDAEERQRNIRLYGKLQAFELSQKAAEGWLVYVYELDKGIGSSSPMKAHKSGWQSGAMQTALLIHYGKSAAEGDFIITEVDEREIQDLEIFGRLRTLRVFEVIGKDRKAESASKITQKTSSSAADVTDTQEVESVEQMQLNPTQTIPQKGPAISSGALRVIAATYGAEETQKDVTAIIAGKIDNGRLEFYASNSEMGGDPIFGKLKELRLKLEINGEEKELVFREGEEVSVP